MPQVGPLEILVVGIVALIVFGPQKLPEMARSVGRALNELKRMASEVRSEFEMGIDDVEDEPEDPAPTPPDEAAEPEEADDLASEDQGTEDQASTAELAEADLPPEDQAPEDQTPTAGKDSA